MLPLRTVTAAAEYYYCCCYSTAVLLLLLLLSLLASVASSQYREQDPPTTAASITVVTVNNCCCYQPALLSASSIGSDEKPEEKFSQGFTGDRAATGGRENESQAPFLVPCAGHQLVPSMGWREGWVWGQLEGGLPTTLVMLGTGVMSRTLVLLLTPQKQPSGGWSFLVSCCP